MELKVGQEVYIVYRHYGRIDKIKKIGRKFVYTEYNGSYYIQGHFPLNGNSNDHGMDCKLYLSKEHYDEVTKNEQRMYDMRFEIGKKMRGYHSVETLEKILKILEDEETN